MFKVLDFHPRLTSALPETHALLQASNLILHERVRRVILHGSRGLANRYRVNSDIDLTVIADVAADQDPESLDLLRGIYDTTLDRWASDIELDLAVVFDIKQCKLKCFGQNVWDPQLCTSGGMDCFGLYKVGKGFNGLVTQASVAVERMYPCLKIWERT